jgi:conjugal transfer pilin signal peptidase TrbI
MSIVKRNLWVVFIALSILGVYRFFCRPYIGLAWNRTASLPKKFYVILKKRKRMVFKRGDIIAFRAPNNPLYQPHAIFLKHIGGVPGDKVSQRKRNFYVNQRWMGRAALYSEKTRMPLFLGYTGTIPLGQYYVYSPHAKSYDSRYQQIGWIHKEAIVGRAYSVF